MRNPRKRSIAGRAAGCSARNESGVAMLLRPNRPNTGPLGTPGRTANCGSGKESGVAMLLAIFTLLLLTVMGLSLLCAADLETTIAANYRDKQVSMYAALSGLQEARDRLIPSRCAQPIGTACADAIAMDTRSMGVPSVTDPNGVLYIINPAPGETIAPWDPNPNNKYFDTELCQENILGLAPPANPGG